MQVSVTYDDSGAPLYSVTLTQAGIDVTSPSERLRPPLIRATGLRLEGVRQYAVRTLCRVTNNWAAEEQIGEGATGSVYRCESVVKFLFLGDE